MLFHRERSREHPRSVCLMAALVLTAAASAFAGSIGAGAFTTALITGAAAAGGAFLNSMVVGALTPTQRQKVDAGGISDLRIQTSTESSPIPEGYGRFRIAGQVIWATRLLMEVNTETETVGGKGGGGRTEVTTTTRLYFGNFAIGLCEGPIAGIGRVWADGKPLDLTGIVYRAMSPSWRRRAVRLSWRPISAGATWGRGRRCGRPARRTPTATSAWAT